MSSDDERAPVTADRPDSAFHVTGTDHVTLIGSNEADTIEFYRDVLGMSLVLRQPNLDAPDVTHLFFDTGDGRILTFFVEDNRDSHEGPQRVGVGGVHHLAFQIEAGELEEIKESLRADGYGYSEFDRGAFHSLYTRDHNGLTIELVVDKYEIPDDRRGEVLALAQAKRVDAGAEYVDDEQMQAALEELGLPAERADVPDAATGTGISE
ncbi:VOC family protein [Candidatus Halobonum tyrrellensis]|uniref:Lactoylglutathione lyase-like lyase n=1 Tax=Candidatus Halobonum tyrrellensis G22 TaxID=1324957 RepID=V4IVY2_9EURY|nr:VOC family protein [Candidatus Halobonum tyrrellensis]ESP87307.1 lactoylglutathione lyase-like lyase [Candidatus Halobonum tyrrellensis G22]